MYITIDKIEDKGLIKPTEFLGGTKFDIYRACMKVLGLKFNDKLRGYLVDLGDLRRVLLEFKERGWNVQISTKLMEAAKAKKREKVDRLEQARRRINEVNERLAKDGKALYAYQEEAIEQLAPLDAAIVAEAMGLGKTVMAILSVPDDWDIIITCPSVAKGVWLRELAFWRPYEDIDVIKKRHDTYKIKSQVTIMSMDSIPAKVELKKGRRYVYIADEAHGFKSAKAQRTSRGRSLARRVLKQDGAVWPMTGTPILNKVTELYAICVFGQSHNKVFGSAERFREGYNAIPGDFGGYVYGDPEPWVIENLSKVMIRHDKEEVLPDLPSKQYITYPVEITKKSNSSLDRYTAKLLDGFDSLEDALDSKLKFTEISVVRKELATAKIPAMLDLVEQYESNEEPVIVASAHRAPIDALEGREGWAVITGSTSSRERTRIEERFQRGELLGIGMTIKAGGVAITLTHASHMLFVDVEWTPGINDQCEDRIHRIGQNSSCVYSLLQSNHPIDIAINEKLQQKKYIIRQTIGRMEKK